MEIDYKEKERNFRQFFTDKYEFHKSGATVFANLVRSLLIDELPINDVLFRVKSCQESIDKFNRKYRNDLETNGTDYEINNFITDLVGVRVICLYEDDIYRISEILRRNFDETSEPTDKSSILEQSKNQFGYKGYHMDLEFNQQRLTLDEYKKYVGVKFEVQIRTIVQDAWSVIDHKIKYKKNIPQNLERSINRLAAVFEIADQEFLRIRNETVETLDSAITNLDQSEALKEEPLNVFTFSSIIWNKFNKYNLAGDKIDGFVEEVKQAKPDINAGNILEAIDKYLNTINLYSNSKQIYMNPYTKLRYCLFLYDRSSFNQFLYPNQQKIFRQWVKERSDNQKEKKQVEKGAKSEK